MVFTITKKGINHGIKSPKYLNTLRGETGVKQSVGRALKLAPIYPKNGQLTDRYTSL